MPRAIILTALPSEYQAVHRHLEHLEEVVHPKGTVYEKGRAGPWEILLAEVGAGSPNAALEAERAITYFSPRIAVLVGIATGRKEVLPGDVVVATKVYGYESGRAGERFRPHPEVGNPAYPLLQRAQAEGRRDDWLRRIPEPRPSQPPKVFLAPLAAGEKIVASTQSAVALFLSKSYDDALAVEREGYGFLRVVQASAGVLALVVRGISDLLAGDGLAATGDEQQAARNAAAFALQVLAKMEVESVETMNENSSFGPREASPDERWPEASRSLPPIYDDLVIRFTAEPETGGCLAQVVSSPIGPSESVRLDAALIERPPRFWAALESTIQNGSGAARDAMRRPSETALDLDPKALGRELYESLFRGSLREISRECLASVRSQKAHGLRLLLEVDPRIAGEVGTLPWELLYHHERRSFLGRSLRTAIVRRLEPSRAFTPRAISRLRILVLLADPEGVPPLKVAEERRLIENALGSRPGVALDFLERPTLGRLRQRVRRQPFDVLHFVGHGGFDRAGEGVLFFEDEERQSAQVTGAILAEQLSGFEDPPRLVFLNACKTGQLPRSSLGRDPYQGVASALLKSGVSAVIAMQFAITDRAALRFGSELYGALAHGDPLESAVVEGRLALHRSQPSTWEWATPVLFLGVPTGELFRIAAEPGASREPAKPPSLTKPEPTAARLEKALELLDLQRFEAAKEALGEALEETEENEAAAGILLHRALAWLNGQRPRSARPDVIRQIEDDLWQAGHRLRGREPAELWLFRALIQHDHYRLNGLRQKPPTVEELLTEARAAMDGGDPAFLRRLLVLAPTPPSPVRQAIEERLAASGSQEPTLGPL